MKAISFSVRYDATAAGDDIDNMKRASANDLWKKRKNYGQGVVEGILKSVGLGDYIKDNHAEVDFTKSLPSAVLISSLASVLGGDPSGIDKYLSKKKFVWKEAVDYTKSLKGVLPGDFYRNVSVARTQAFTLKKASSLIQINKIKDSLVAAIGKGDTFKMWASGLKDTLPKASKSYHDLVYQNAVSASYNSGRYEQAIKVKAERPVWVYDAVRDKRTTPLCSSLHDQAHKNDDPFWEENMPPNHHNCRSSFFTLSESQVDSMGVELGGTTEYKPDKGWSGNHAKVTSVLKIDKKVEKKVVAKKAAVKAFISKKQIESAMRYVDGGVKFNKFPTKLSKLARDALVGYSKTGELKIDDRVFTGVADVLQVGKKFYADKVGSGVLSDKKFKGAVEVTGDHYSFGLNIGRGKYIVKHGWGVDADGTLNQLNVTRAYDRLGVTDIGKTGISDKFKGASKNLKEAVTQYSASSGFYNNYLRYRNLSDESAKMAVAVIKKRYGSKVNELSKGFKPLDVNLHVFRDMPSYVKQESFYAGATSTTARRNFGYMEDNKKSAARYSMVAVKGAGYIPMGDEKIFKHHYPYEDEVLFEGGSYTRVLWETAGTYEKNYEAVFLGSLADL